MIVAVGAVVAKVAKEVLAILAGDKNGRKFLGYVIGIVLFIVLLPVIAVYGLFGWMAGGGANRQPRYGVLGNARRIPGTHGAIQRRAFHD